MIIPGRHLSTPRACQLIGKVRKGLKEALGVDKLKIRGGKGIVQEERRREEEERRDEERGEERRREEERRKKGEVYKGI